MQPKEQAFWDSLAEIGRDILSYGDKLDYGNVLMEVKMRDGVPAIIVRSASKNTMFKDNAMAKIAIEKSLSEREKTNFDGAQTFTVIWHKGQINRILVDEYKNLVL